MKYTTVKLSEIANHPTMRMDAQYWIRKKKDKHIKDTLENDMRVIMEMARERVKNVQSNTKRKVQREKNRSEYSK